MNISDRSPQDCVATTDREVGRLIRLGVCTECAVRATADKFDIDSERLLALYSVAA